MLVSTCFNFGVALMATKWTISAYDTENTNLTGIQINGASFNRLILSNFNITAVAKNAFANLSHLRTLDLSENSLTSLPVLENLTELETLNLANNDIRSGKFYANLNSLKILDLSNNSLTHCEPGHFFGLSKHTDIITQGLHLLWITAAMFEDSVTVDSRRPLLTAKKIKEDDELLSEEDDIEIEVCIQDGNLMSVSKLKNVTSLPEGCRKVNSSSETLYLNEMGIKTFEHGWYQLHDFNLTSIVLSDNEIVQFTKELLNDLPAGIVQVYLSRNKIEKLETGIIENRNNINLLDLSNNSISTIENGALEKLNLTKWLLLDGNSLKNTKFLDSLPHNIESVSLNRNKITEISAGNFNKYANFKLLSLVNNDIEEIKANKLCGFLSLTHIALQENVLRNIESRAFQDLKNLLYLDLTNNSITSPKRSMFSGLMKIKHISLESNGIKDVVTDLLTTMPFSLQIFSLGKNNIKLWSNKKSANKWENWEGSRWNPSFIERFTRYNFPNLRILDLNENLLTDFEGDLFKRIKNLVYLSVVGNKITKIDKGFAQYLGNLHILDISENPIKKLTNGALFGLRKDSRTVIHVRNVSLESIQGGLFDDV